MVNPSVERPDLPEFMTWAELELLPEELSSEIELWDGRVVRVRRGPMEHQEYTNLLWGALRHWVRHDREQNPRRCWRVATETNIFLKRGEKSDFLTPDFLICRCLEQEYSDLYASDVLLVGEVLSPSNYARDIEAKKARYAAAGIPWYWEVTLGREPRGIAMVRTFALEKHPGELPPGVTPLRPKNYLVIGEWSPSRDPEGIDTPFPFPIQIPWSELEF